MEYCNIIPYNLGVLNKENSQLRIFIETQAQTIIAKLDRNSLNLKISYTICHQNQEQKICLDVQKQIYKELQRKTVINSRGQWIKKYGITVSQLTQKGRILVFYQFQLIFEKLFNISLRDIEDTDGRHTIKKIGNFLILKKDYGIQIMKPQHLIYYISRDFILQGDGAKGKIYLKYNEHLKMIKCINNSLYVVIAQDGYFEVYEIKGEYERRELIYYSFIRQSLKKPILYQKHIIFTNKTKRFILKYAN